MAKRFYFRLEKVLKLRKDIENIRVRELSHAKGKLLKIQEELNEHMEKEIIFLNEFSEFEKNINYNSGEIIAFCEYKEWLTYREKDYRVVENDLIQEVEKRQKILVKASREKKVLENLREKKLLLNNNEIYTEERRFLDEISSISFIRRDRVEKARESVLAVTI